jgi:REP element-mobilizing transposase RayT
MGRHSIDEFLADCACQRHAMRLRRLGDSRSGTYFITFCTADRSVSLAEVIGDRLRLTHAGKIVACAWPFVLGRYPHVRLLESVVMPDHVHALLRLDATAAPSKSLGRIVGAVKTRSAARVNRLRESPGSPVWQSGFYDRIIRSPRMLATIREYIRNNPRRWLEAAGIDSPSPD